jgi:uncharacterized protein (TIGR03437 family)
MIRRKRAGRAPFAGRLAGKLHLATLFVMNLSPALAQAPVPVHIRGVHMAENWGGNIGGIKPPITASAQSISAASVTTGVSRGSYTDATGVIVPYELAQVKLTGVVLGGGAKFAQAGFALSRRKDDLSLTLQFTPSWDTSLSGIAGFNGDVHFSVSADGAKMGIAEINGATGPARDYVIAVAAHAAELVQAGTFGLNDPGATLDKTSLVNALKLISASINAGSYAGYFQYLKKQNVEWVGVMLAMFNDTITDPVVKVWYRPPGETSGTDYTFEDGDLQSYAAAARESGIKLYWVLAIEPPPMDDASCNTAQYRVPRWLLGQPTTDRAQWDQGCIDPKYWWWDPAHPDHARNVAQFWDTYTQVAVKFARLAQQSGVSMFSLGTETDNLFRTRPGAVFYTDDFRAQLTSMVAAVRREYSGILTYDQQWYTSAHPEWVGNGHGTAVVFGNLFNDLDLDVVGISAYYALADAEPTNVISLPQMEAAWETVFQKYVIPLQAANAGKPIVFTETGYTDDVRSPTNSGINHGGPLPLVPSSGITPGMQQQINIYQAFFNVNARYNDLVTGAFFWGHEMDVVTEVSSPMWWCSHVTIGGWCKPAERILADVYGRWQANPVPAGTLTSVTVAGGGSDIAQNAWIEIRGKNLVPTNAPSAGVIWSNSPEFGAGRMPVQIGGVPVTATVNGKAAYIYFLCSAATNSACASDQVNVLTPFDSTVGPVRVVVYNGGIPSSPFTVNLRAASPAFPLFGSTSYIVATHANYSLAGPASLSAPGYPVSPAQPGETIIVYGFGFGLPVTALTGGAASQSGSLPSLPVFQIGGLPATVSFAGLVSPGLY